VRVLVTGAGGMLARAVVGALGARDHDVVALDRAALDVTDAAAVDRRVQEARPHAVIQCAAYTRVDDAEQEEDRATLVNAGGAGFMARACRRVGARFVYPSTDYVFDGASERPYRPEDRTAPVNAYGRSKLRGEAAAQVAGDWLVVRTSWLYGPGGGNFVTAILERARNGGPLRVVDDQRSSPTWTRDLAAALVSLLEQNAAPGIYHAANRGDATWYDLAVEAVRLSALDVEVEPISSEAVSRPAARPSYSVLDTASTEAVAGPFRPWHDALAAALEEGI